MRGMKNRKTPICTGMARYLGIVLTNTNAHCLRALRLPLSPQGDQATECGQHQPHARGQRYR